MPLPDDPEVLQISKGIVEQLHTVFGPHPGYRAAHAKGTLLKGHFRPTAEAAALSAAPHFQAASTPMILRFSASTGLPNISDEAGDSFPRGFAARFVLSDDGHRHTDIVAHSLDRFPARTGDEFLALFRALADSEMAVASFLDNHPKAKEFVGARRRMVGSWARDAFWGLNAFKLVAKDGSATFVRYKVEGAEGVDDLEVKDVEGRGESYLADEARQRLAKGPFELKLLAQVAEDGDVTDDVTAYWPAERKVVQLGTIAVEGFADDEGGKESKRIIFDPTPRVDGIEPSADPIIEMRAAVYLRGGRERRAA